MFIALLACHQEDPDPTLICTPASPDDILERKGDYYRCLDDQLIGGEGCGPEGYPLGYGRKYADRFFDLVYPEISPIGQVFLEQVSICLQSEMAAWVTSETACTAVWDHGFETHPPCYLESGFCDVPFADVAAIAAAVDPEDQALPEAQEQMAQILAGCE